MRTVIRNTSSLLTWVSTFLLLVFASGCGFFPTDDGSGNSSQQNQTVNSSSNTPGTTDQQSQVTPVQPNQVNAEIPFDTVSYIPYDFKPRPKGGIYIYTKEAHAGAISDTFKYDWDEKDILYVQLGEQYRGYKIEPMALEKKDAKTLRLILKLQATDDVGKSDEDPARKFIKVPKGSLNGYSFEVVDISGKQLSLQ